MIQEEPVIAGYFPKITLPAPDSIGRTGVKEICSVSECLSHGPENWIDRWKHNERGFYDTEELALEIIGDEVGKFDLYAYKLFPFYCIDNKVETVELEKRIGELGSDYEFLGYDIVNNEFGAFFGCSPLSCNYGAREYEVNRYCLIDEREKAYEILLDIAAKGISEPGPYYLIEVYRKRA